MQATRVLSYRVLFFTLYSLDLRLTVADIDAERRRVHIRGPLFRFSGLASAASRFSQQPRRDRLRATSP